MRESPDQTPEQPRRAGILRALYNELNRRGVLRVGGLYVVASWVAIQASDILYQPLGFERSPVRAIIIIALIGFPFAIAGAWFFNISRDAAESTELTRYESRMALLAAVAFGVLVVLFGGWLALRPAAEKKTADVRPTSEQPDHVAVLYFQDRTPKASTDSSDSYLAGAITESLIDQLAEVDSISVISSNGVRQYRNSDVPPDSIARSLNVGTLVTGGVTTTKDSVFVQVSMLEPSGEIAKSTSVRRARGEAVALVSDVSAKVSDFLRGRIGEELINQRWHRAASNDTAWILLQRSHASEQKAHVAMDRSGPRAGLQFLIDADSLAAQSERADPSYGEATVWRAWLAYGRAFALFDPRDQKELPTRAALDEGYAHASRALVRHPGDTQALEARGALAVLELALLNNVVPNRDQLKERAEADLRAAALRDPGRARAMSNLSSLLSDRGDYENAAVFAAEAFKADAYQEDKGLLVRLFNIAFETGNDADAEKWCNEDRRRNGGEVTVAYCKLQILAWSRAIKPSIPDAWAAMASAKDPPPIADFMKADFEMMVAGVIARAGKPDSARAVLNRALARKSPDPELLQLEAGVRVLLHDDDKAKLLLEQYEKKFPAKVGILENSRRFTTLHLTQPRPDGTTAQ